MLQRTITMLAKLRILLSRLFILFVFILMIFTSTASYYHHFKYLPAVFMLLGVVFVGVGVVGRIWCGVYIAGFKNSQLITKGPYSLCRNPLYFFSFIGMIGLGLLSSSLAVTLLLLIAFSIYYPFVILSEEAKLRKIFNDQYSNYYKKTPSFLPKISNLNEPNDYEIRPVKFKKALIDVVWFIWSIGGMVFLYQLKLNGAFPVYFNLF